MDNFSITQTLLLLICYMVTYLFFRFKNFNSFFLRPQSYKKIDSMIAFTSLTSLLFILWNSFFSNYLFLGLKISNETIFFNDKFITFLGVALAVIGWLYTVRSQLVTNMKNHSIQIIMNARLSECYNIKFEEVTLLLDRYIESSLPLEKYLSLDLKDQGNIRYVLNYYEFIAISIRYNEFDEAIVKSMMRSSTIQTYQCLHEVIEYLQTKSLSQLEHLSCLNKRWQSY